MLAWRNKSLYMLLMECELNFYIILNHLLKDKHFKELATFSPLEYHKHICMNGTVQASIYCWPLNNTGVRGTNPLHQPAEDPWYIFSEKKKSACRWTLISDQCCSRSTVEGFQFFTSLFVLFLFGRLINEIWPTHMTISICSNNKRMFRI